MRGSSKRIYSYLCCSNLNVESFMEKFQIEEKIVAMLKTVYDPEIPVDVYELGLIYKIDVADSGDVVIDMTLTAPNCPAADFIMEDVDRKSTRLNSSHANISYAVFCLKKKIKYYSHFKY